ncbi:hypothetical protein [Phenylobacterium sp.]|uniref:hypothetical protein n=1 Tax=Phenylobacterium sp. TaxID=1871053 RepID=UPI002C13F493|nr:hypothetical protein [Phenylobacterium sp.]HVI30563.1 hypothetical protein [Phenylobacterium sp.]
MRLHRRVLVAALALPLLHSRDGPVGAEQLSRVTTGDGRILSARKFLDGLGVNAHVSWPGHYPYSQTGKVIAALDYLGVRKLRDYINSSTLPVFERLAASGVRLNLLLNPKVGLDNYLGWARSLARNHPGSVAALEGPNEVDKWPVTFGRLEGFAAAVATQRALYAGAKSDPVLAKAPVYNLTISGISRSKSAALGDLSAHADYANVHPYYRAGQQSWGHSLRDTRYTLKNYLASARWTAPGRPVVLTETGSTTAVGSAIGVSEEIQARQILNSLMAAAAHQVAATYIYELVDSHDAGPQDVESHYGLYRYDWTPKPAAMALHNLTRILGRGRGARAPRASPAPEYMLTGMPAAGRSLLFRLDDGTYAIVLWAEPDLWNEDASVPIAAPTVTAHIAFSAVQPSVLVYDPLVSDRPLRSLGPTRRLGVPVSDHPLIVQVSRAPASGGAYPGAVTAPPAS